MFISKEVIAATLAMASLSGCATIVTGTSQQISVNTYPQGAKCDLWRHDLVIASIDSTPASMTVSRSKYDIKVECSKKGYETAHYTDRSAFETASAGNAFIGGLIGLGIDSATGASNKYNAEVVIPMAPVAVATATPAPTVPYAAPKTSTTVPGASSATVPQAHAAGTATVNASGVVATAGAHTSAAATKAVIVAATAPSASNSAAHPVAAQSPTHVASPGVAVAAAPATVNVPVAPVHATIASSTPPGAASSVATSVVSASQTSAKNVASATGASTPVKPQLPAAAAMPAAASGNQPAAKATPTVLHPLPAASSVGAHTAALGESTSPARANPVVVAAKAASN